MRLDALPAGSKALLPSPAGMALKGWATVQGGLIGVNILAILLAFLSLPGSADTGERTLTGPELAVRSVVFAPDGKTLASVGGRLDREGEVLFWDVARGTERLRLPRRAEFDSTAFAGHADFGVVPFSPGSALAFSPDSAFLATVSQDKTVRIWDAATGLERGTLEGASAGVVALAFSPDGQRLASGSWDRTVQVWKLGTAPAQLHLEGVGQMAFSPDGRLLACGSPDRTVKLWDLATGKVRARLLGSNALVQRVAFSPDGRIVAGSAHDHKIYLWDVSSCQLTFILEGHTDVVLVLAFSPEGRTLVTGANDRTIKLWEVATGREQASWVTPSCPAMAVAFAAGGKLLAAGSLDRTVRLWAVN